MRLNNDTGHGRIASGHWRTSGQRHPPLGAVGFGASALMINKIIEKLKINEANKTVCSNQA